MSSTAEVKAASYIGPTAGAASLPASTDPRPGNTAVRLATSSTNISPALRSVTTDSGRIVIPWQGKYVDVTNEDPVNGLDFAFSNGAQTLVYGQIGTLANGGHAASGERIQPGQTRSFICPADATHANAVLGAAGPSTMTLRCSEGNVPTK